jgi:flagellar basal body-associated protein FliL
MKKYWWVLLAIVLMLFLFAGGVYTVQRVGKREDWAERGVVVKIED